MAFAMILRGSGFNSPLMRLKSFRSDAELEALWKAGEDEVPNLVLYNYPSLFAHLFHTRLNLRCLILLFSYVEPFRADDISIENMEKCYLLDCIGPEGFAAELYGRSSTSHGGIYVTRWDTDHRKSVPSRIQRYEEYPKNLEFHVDVGKSSSSAAYEYFSKKLGDMMPSDSECVSLLSAEDREHVIFIDGAYQTLKCSILE